jgi:hypothetical protein
MTRTPLSQNGPTPKETIRIIDELLQWGHLTECEFEAMHHMRHPPAKFQSYCATIAAFQPESRNRCLAERLLTMHGQALRQSPVKRPSSDRRG